MELRTNDVDVDHANKLSRSHKFGVIQSPETQNSILIVFNILMKHHIEIENLMKKENVNQFIGAGFIYENGHIFFESDTCKSTWGFDRPNSESDQEAVIQQIRSLLQEKGYIS